MSRLSWLRLWLVGVAIAVNGSFGPSTPAPTSLTSFRGMLLLSSSLATVQEAL